MTVSNPNREALSELERLAKAAGDGTWQASGESVEYAEAPGIPILVSDPEGMYRPEDSRAWCAFIAAANPAFVLALLAERDALRAALEQIKSLSLGPDRGSANWIAERSFELACLALSPRSEASHDKKEG